MTRGRKMFSKQVLKSIDSKHRIWVEYEDPGGLEFKIEGVPFNVSRDWSSRLILHLTVDDIRVETEIPFCWITGWGEV